MRTIGNLYHSLQLGDLPLSSLRWRYRFTSLESFPSDSGTAPEIGQPDKISPLQWGLVTRIILVYKTTFPQEATSDLKA